MNQFIIDDLSWQALPSDSALLCQFMMGYEVRTGQYLVGYDGQHNIVAAGHLYHINDSDAYIELVVRATHRGGGIGSILVKLLIAEANERSLQRLQGRGEPGFWLKQGFLPTANSHFALLLSQATATLEHTWHTGIPMTDYMGLRIIAVSPTRFATGSELAASINVHQTMFAGGIYSQAVLTGWGLVHMALQRAGIQGSIVLAQGNIRYRKPLSQNPQGIVEQEIELNSLLPILSGKKVSIELEVKMFCQQQTRAAAIFDGRYVIIPIS